MACEVISHGAAHGGLAASAALRAPGIGHFAAPDADAYNSPLSMSAGRDAAYHRGHFDQPFSASQDTDASGNKPFVHRTKARKTAPAPPCSPDVRPLTPEAPPRSYDDDNSSDGEDQYREGAGACCARGPPARHLVLGPAPARPRGKAPPPPPNPPLRRLGAPRP